MTDDDLENQTNGFMHALAASDADVANISADRTEDGMVVTFDLLDSYDAELVRDVAAEHGFEEQGGKVINSNSGNNSRSAICYSTP